MKSELKKVKATIGLIVSAMVVLVTVAVVPTSASAEERTRTATESVKTVEMVETVKTVKVVETAKTVEIRDATRADADILSPMEKYCVVHKPAEDLGDCLDGQPTAAVAAINSLATDDGEPVVYHSIGQFDADWLCENAPSGVHDFCMDFAWCVMYNFGCGQGAW